MPPTDPTPRSRACQGSARSPCSQRAPNPLGRALTQVCPPTNSLLCAWPHGGTLTPKNSTNTQSRVQTDSCPLSRVQQLPPGGGPAALSSQGRCPGVAVAPAGLEEFRATVSSPSFPPRLHSRHAFGAIKAIIWKRPNHSVFVAAYILLQVLRARCPGFLW